MKQMIIGVLGVVWVGCIPGEATIKLSAENVRSVLKGEVVEVPVHGEVELMVPIAPGDDEMKCPECEGRDFFMIQPADTAGICYNTRRFERLRTTLHEWGRGFDSLKCP